MLDDMDLLHAEAHVRYPDLSELSERLNVYGVGLYRVDAAGRRYLLSSALVVTLATEEELRDQLECIRRQIEEDYVLELIDIASVPSIYHYVVVAVDRPLRPARRSPETGRIYDESVRYCPHTGKRTLPAISA